MHRLTAPKVAVRTLAFLVLHPLVALAQPAPPAPAAPQAEAPASPAPAASQAEAPAPKAPKTIEVSDPDLAPVPPAPRVLGSWEDILKLVDRRTPELVIAMQEVVRAEALARQALAGALPSLVGTARVSHDILPASVPGGPDATAAGVALTLSQPILAPRAWYGIGTAKLQVEVAKLSEDDRRRIVLASVADSVVSVVTAERVGEINRVGLRSALERLELTRRRERLGTGTKLDVVRAEQDVALARAQLVSGDESLRRAREALALAMGSDEAFGVASTISLNAIEQSVRTACTQASPDQRADVRASRIELEIAERSITDAKLAFAPTAEVSSTLNVSTQSTLGEHVAWSIQGVLTLPIWEGGARYGSLRASKAAAEQQRARVDATRRAAQLDAGQALRAVSVAEQSRAVAERTRDLARETARLTQVAFEAGTATSFDLVESGRRQREAELDLAVREFELVKAKIAALLATASCR